MEFKQLGIIEEILKTLEGFEKPTEIQAKAIPLVLQGKDVIAGSATGSGKTLAFGVGIIQNAVKGKGIQGLILTPTRELAEQVKKALVQFSKFKPLKITAIYGGVSINPQMDELRTSDVVVGTPGRILDHLERGTINLKNVRFLVLDEADRMLDMGFIEDVEKIISQCSKERQTMLFSATIAPEIQKLAQNYMNNPAKVSAESYVDPRKLKQVYFDVPDNLKFSLLVHLLKNEKKGLVMIFCNSRETVDFVASNLKANGIEASAIHGGFAQAKRLKIMDEFHSKNAHVLVCTDVAARGLDIPDVSHIYNYDIPKDSKEYVHRIGRTARAGKEGIAINILSQKQHDNFSRVLRDNDVNVEKEKTPYIQKINVRMHFTRRPRSFGGPRGHSGPRIRSGPRHIRHSHNRPRHSSPRRRHS